MTSVGRGGLGSCIGLERTWRLSLDVHGPWVFMTNRGSKRSGDTWWEQFLSFRTVFETACRHAKLSGVTPHLLRHPFASRLVTLGVDERTGQESGGWKSLDVVQWYAHFSQDHNRQAVELLAEISPAIIPASAQEPERVEDVNSCFINMMGR